MERYGHTDHLLRRPTMRILALVAAVVATTFFFAVLAVRLAHYGYFGDVIFDDAFFFVRYAGNFLDTGIFEWNRGEGPVHGNTSQFYQLLVTLIHWLTDRDIVLSLSISVMLGAAVYFVVLPASYAVLARQIDPRTRLLTLVVVMILTAFNGHLFPLISAGMETTWAMAAVALSLLASFHIDKGRLGWRPVAANAAAILFVYGVRPDAMILALAAPAGLLLFSRERQKRLAGAAVCGLAAIFVGLFVAACWLYYGDAFPLASITKMPAFTALPPELRVKFGNSLVYLAGTLLFYKAEVILAVGALPMFFHLSPVLRGAAIGAAAFTFYHAFLVSPVTGDFGRFYAPMVPVLVLLAAQSVEAIVDYARRDGASRKLAALLILGLVVLLGHRVLRTGISVGAEHLPSAEMRGPINTAAGAMAAAAKAFSFFDNRLESIVKSMDAACSIASTEDGMLSAYAYRNRIIDMSGLHDRQMAHRGFSPDRLLIDQKPDILVMPHDWYGAWIAALERHPVMLRDYLKEERLPNKGPWIAFRRDSDCAAKVRKALYGRP